MEGKNSQANAHIQSQTGFAYRQNIRLAQYSTFLQSYRNIILPLAPAVVLPLLAGNLLRLGAPAHWHQSQVV